MPATLFYRAQADQQQRAADDAVLENVRERCQCASEAWTVLAERRERNELVRSQAAADKHDDEPRA